MTSMSSLDQLSVTPPRSRAEQLADTLLDHIRARGLGPGDRLGTLDEIRAEVGFARTTVSEAVRLLRERGALEIRPGRGGGLFIAAETPVVRMRHTLLTAQGSVVSVRDAIELREALEAPIALSVAAVCSDTDIEVLRDAAEAMARTGADFEEFIRLNWHLHELIAGLSPNAMMSAVYTSCLGYLGRSAPSYGDDDAVSDYIADRAAAHLELVEAIGSRDAARIAAAVAAHNHGTAGEADATGAR
ncbi:FCD domain-containing protein [Leucobacter allii]|uniref:FCD domain-containing protein n=1 Tax=Leucobacter allii TaxID=2932247 RepID=A0ABY4FJ50_9MICO|nr:FCD domain-containing protein [Leucobacter allii]UOQ56710.1 FCD domain-containing protein [Leucobacter allii]UOR01143.1 FCD domain-containing protein [Leucobacter allii]